MKKKGLFIAIGAIVVAVIIITAILILGKFTTKLSYTYEVNTGDKITLSLNTTDGYSMTQDMPFSITKDDGIISRGTFIEASAYEVYESSMDLIGGIVNSDKGEKDGITYLYFNYNNTEFDYIIKINDSNTGLLLSNSISEESAKEMFERLSFEIIK